jgi:hypothetical protein
MEIEMSKEMGAAQVWFVSIVAGLLLISCGYQVVKEKGIYGGEITSLAVPIFKNSTYEPHASLPVTEAFAKELVSTGLFKVNKDDPDGTLEGVIKAIRTAPSTLNKDGIVIEKQIAMDLELSLFRRNRVLVKRWPLTESEIYRVDNTEFEDYNKRDALRKISARLARRFTSVLLVDY